MLCVSRIIIPNKITVIMTSLIPAAFRPLRLALIQLATTADKTANLSRARVLVKEACSNGANVVVLPVNDPIDPADLR
jgi:hypothetical protein